MHSKTSDTVLQVFLLIVVLIIFSQLATILQPLFLAIMAAMIFQPLILKMTEKRIPLIVVLPIVAVITLTVIAVIGSIVVTTGIEISNQSEYLVSRFQDKFMALIDWGVNVFRLEEQYAKLQTDMFSVISIKTVTGFAGDIAQNIGSFSSSFLMFALYYIMILPGMANYKRYISFVGQEGKSGESLMHNFEKIHKTIMGYLSVKNTTSLITATIFYVLCLFFGIKFAIFWAFLTYVLNFIPTIGSIIATFFPTIMLFIQTDSYGVLAFFFILAGTVQFLVGSIIEPIIMSNKLSLNTVTVLIGLFFWGAMWGVTGMMLSVPLMVILRLILERIPNLAIIGRMMGSSKPGRDENKQIKEIKDKINSTINKSK
jgi:predicted PurR-regulated permease PerM